jgi:hypothetical protein
LSKMITFLMSWFGVALVLGLVIGRALADHDD